jgi:hypothetical protein
MQTFGTVLVASLVALATGLGQAADVPSNKAVTVKAPRTADAFVRSGSSSRRNYGSEKTLELRSASRDRVSESYLQFNIGGMEPSLTNATLWVYAMLDQPGRVTGVVRSFVPAPIDEQQMTWQNRPEHIAVIGRFEVTGVSPVWYQIDVTRYVQEELAAGRSLASFALILAQEGDTRIVIQSRESIGYQPELTVTRRPFVARVHFLPTGTKPAEGWLADNGRPFGPKGGGLMYGWSYDLSNLVRDRSKSAVGDMAGIKPPSRLYETFCPVDALGVQEQPRWEIAVPAGRYHVRMIVGDVEDAASVYAMAAEGQLVVEGLAGGTNRWFEGSAVVPVTDGRLTVTDHPRGSGNKLCAVEIFELERP